MSYKKWAMPLVVLIAVSLALTACPAPTPPVAQIVPTVAVEPTAAPTAAGLVARSAVVMNEPVGDVVEQVAVLPFVPGGGDQDHPLVQGVPDGRLQHREQLRGIEVPGADMRADQRSRPGVVRDFHAGIEHHTGHISQLLAHARGNSGILCHLVAGQLRGVGEQRERLVE